MKKTRFIVCALALLCVMPSMADEGMWLPSLIGDRIKDMRSKGFRLTAEDIYSINKPSLKDAVVLFGGGCTGEVVSPEGLLLTNHHCGYDQIQRHSSVEHDYLTDGFWAMDRSEELPNPGLTVSFLVRMEEVTDEVLHGVSEGMPAAMRDSLVQTNSRAIADRATEDGRYSASVESFYYGNQYFLFVYEVFRDVRLVAAPPSSVGSFGGDTDNWMWPRHTGDFSIFRIYADKNNRPADYSPDNVPYRPKRWFPISTEGVREGDFTMIYGYPGTTRRFVLSDEVDYVAEKGDPLAIDLRTLRLNVIREAQESDPALRIAYAFKAAMIANGWKKWQGESLGLKRLKTADRKREYERRFATWAADKPAYDGVLDSLKSAYDGWERYACARAWFNEAVMGIEMMQLARYLSLASPTDGRIETTLAAFYKDYSSEVDRRIATLLLERYMNGSDEEFVPAGLREKIAEAGGMAPFVQRLFDASALSDPERMAKALAAERGLESLRAEDPMLRLYAMFEPIWSERILPHYSRYDARIKELYRTYVRGLQEFEPQREFFPDANSTLRVAYGHVNGCRVSDGVYYLPVTTLDGVIAKDDPAVYDYDVPQRLRELYEAKDYGRWAIDTGDRKNPHPTVPVAFLADNHTTGGNSGSPVIDGRGRLIGINFDRTWQGTMSDLEFDPAYCRNIAVDIRYVLFIIEKLGGAGWLLEEMTLE